MRLLCRINLEIFACVSKEIATDEVIVTDERIEHIRDRHPNDFECYHAYMQSMLEDPDYILADRPNTALVLKSFVDMETQQYFRLVLKLQTAADEPERKNSVITFMKTNQKKWEQNLRNKVILYRRDKR